MSAPSLRVTMLGASKAGKSVFTMGMFYTLAAGVRSLTARCPSREDEVDLIGQMSRLLDDGLLPAATAEGESRDYKFSLHWNNAEVVTVDWLDYRGGAVDSYDDDEDYSELSSKLSNSDSIYVALDGEYVGEWIRALCDKSGRGRANDIRLKSQLKIPQLTTLLTESLNTRAVQRRRTSVAVIITKMDLLASGTELSIDDAVGVAFKNLKTLMPFLGMNGVTVAVIPVQLGEFGAETDAMGAVDPSQINPLNLHKPFLFSVAERLAIQHEVLARQQAAIDIKINSENSARKAEYEGRIAEYRRLEAAYQAENASHEAQMQENRDMLEFYRGSTLRKIRSRRDIEELQIELASRRAPVPPVRPPEPIILPREWASIPDSDLNFEALEPVWQGVRQEVSNLQVMKDGQRMRWSQAYPY